MSEYTPGEYQARVTEAIADWGSFFDGLRRHPQRQPVLRSQRKAAHRRRIRYMGTDPAGASLFEMYSRSRSKDTCHQIRVHFENGEFWCSCEHHHYRGANCEHIRRACAWERRRRARA